MSPGSRTSVLKAFPSLLRVGFAEMVAYRAEVVIWILTASAPLIMLAVFDRVADDGPVSGFERGDFAAYFVAVLIVRQLTSAWVVWELNEKIRTGGLSPALLKPLHPLAWYAASTVATVPFRLVVMIPLVGLLWLWRPEMRFGLSLAALPPLVLSLALAWVMNFAIQCSFGCLAFWMGQSIGIFGVWFGLWSLFSGYIIPIDLLPGGIADVAAYLPFRALLSAPVEIALGRTSGASALGTTLALQVFWAGVAVLIARAVWTRGIARYEAYGA